MGEKTVYKLRIDVTSGKKLRFREIALILAKMFAETAKDHHATFNPDDYLEKGEYAVNRLSTVLNGINPVKVKAITAVEESIIYALMDSSERESNLPPHIVQQIIETIEEKDNDAGE